MIIIISQQVVDENDMLRVSRASEDSLSHLYRSTEQEEGEVEE